MNEEQKIFSKTTDLLKKQLASRVFLVSLFLFMEIFIVLFFVGEYVKHASIYISKIQQAFEANYKGAVISYNNSTRMIFNDVVNKPEVLKLVSLALNDKEKRAVYRNELYRLMLPSYEKQKTIGIRQFHFHLRDGTSFLRMHAPDKYGDNLFRRPAVKLINTEKKFVEGFEVGYFAGGYRYMYPLFYNGEHIGSVEFALTAVGTINYLGELYPGQYSFIIDRTVVDEITYADWKKSNYRQSNLSDMFLMDRNENPTDLVLLINQNLKSKVHDRLAGMERFAEKQTVKGTDYLIVFLPVKDIKGNPVAYFVKYINDDYSGHQFRWTILNIVLFTLLGGTIFYFIDRIKTSHKFLQHKNIELEQITGTLYKSEKKYRDMFESATDAIFILDLDGNFIDVSSIAYKRLGYSKEEMLSMHISQLDPPEFAAKIPERFAQLREHGFAVFESAHIRKDGTVMPVEINARLYDYEGKKVYLSFIRDITERKKMEKRLEEAAITDELTGLYNRRGFFTFSENHLRLANRRQTQLSLFFIDLDGMKTINDELGHKIGDEALKDTADILRRTFRASDIIARIGGDEFAVLLTEQQPDSIETVTSHIGNNFAEFNKIAGRPYELMLSIGIARYDYQNPCSVYELLSNADTLMYGEKKHHKRIRRGVGTNAEERKYERFFTGGSFKAEIKSFSDVRIRNLSTHGISLKTPQRLDMDLIYEICLLGMERQLTLTCAVVWSALNSYPDEKGAYWYNSGLKFMNLDDEQRKMLKKFIDQLKEPHLKS